jgi:D-glycero-D-manno-heptose 1,7-bisphosphate phosphatase
MRIDTSLKLVVLDRDGTINDYRNDYVKSADEWVPLPGALEAIARLNQQGWHTVIATNQSGLGRGLFDMAAFNEIHLKLNQALAKLGGRIDAVFFCPHAPEDDCDCRKPRTGLFEDIAKRYSVDLSHVPAVGESLRDVQAAAAAGCEPHLVLSGQCAYRGADEVLRIEQQVPGTRVHADLAAFADFLIRREREQRGFTGDTDSGHGALT